MLTWLTPDRWDPSERGGDINGVVLVGLLEMSVLDVAIRAAKWGAYLGLFCGVLYSVGGFFVDLFTRGLNWGTLLAFGALLGMPAIFAAAGFILGAVVALVAKGTGGLAHWVGR